MDTELWSFMKPFYVDGANVHHTHSSQMNPQFGKFNVDHVHQEDFW